MPEMIRYVRAKESRLLSGIRAMHLTVMLFIMCWGEYEVGYSLDKSAPYIDCNGFYMDWMDSQGGVLQTFFSTRVKFRKLG